MSPADQAYVEQSKVWIENQKNAIAYNQFLINVSNEQIRFLELKKACEMREMEASKKTLELYEQQLEQFIEERKDL